MSAGPGCLEMDALLAERASGDLPAEDRSRLEAHLPRCDRCQAELARYQDALRLAGERGSPLAPEGRGPGLAGSTLRLWRRSERRRRLGVAVVSGTLAAAAAVCLSLAPGLHGRQATHPSRDQAHLSSWEPDVDGALEASGLRGGSEQEEATGAEDVVLAAFDAAEED